MANQFLINCVNENEYRKPLAYIYYENSPVLKISQEKGVDQMEIEILFPDETNNPLIFPLDDLTNAILLAQQQLSVFNA